MDKSETEGVVFPEREVILLDNTRVMIKPWTLKNGRIQRRRITKVLDELRKGGKDFSIASAFELCEAEITAVVADTIGWTVEELEDKIHYEDLFTLAQGVIDTCLLREGGGGVLGKVVGATNLLGQESSIAPELKARLEEARALAADPEKTPVS